MHFKHNLQDSIMRAKQSGAIDSAFDHPLTVRGDHPNEDDPKADCEVCPRTTQASMLQRYQGRYVCDGCWTALRRVGKLTKVR